MGRVRGGAGATVHYHRPASIAAPLMVPTFDDGPSVTHPSVVDFGTAWNGYRYWMAYTPYPGAGREDPSIVASSDKETWEVPAGLASPRLVTRDQIIAAGYTYGSDTHLLYTDGQLWLYYRAYTEVAEPSSGTEGIFRMESSDGVTWSTPTEIISSELLKATLSPTVVEEGDGSYTMWTVNAQSSPSTVERRTSTDGLSWSTSTTCTIPLRENPWHVDVVLRGGSYHMLSSNLVGGAATKLAYLTSADGVTWMRLTDDRSVPLSGLTFDAGGRHYRSCFLPAGTQVDHWGRTIPLWDIWVSGLPADHATGGDWRLGLYRNIALR